LLAVLAVKFILCELFLGGAVAGALVVKLRFATFFSSRASGTVGVFSRSQSPLSVLFRLAQATARHTGLIRDAAKRDIIAVLKFNRYDYRASRLWSRKFLLPREQNNARFRKPHYSTFSFLTI